MLQLSRWTGCSTSPVSGFGRGRTAATYSRPTKRYSGTQTEAERCEAQRTRSAPPVPGQAALQAPENGPVRNQWRSTELTYKAPQ